MIKNNNDISFIHDIGSLDRLRQQAVNGEEGSEERSTDRSGKTVWLEFSPPMLF